MVKSKKSAHQKKQDIRVKNNILLPILCAAIPIIVFIVAFLITTPNMKEDNDAINILGVVAQIVASIVCCVISVLGIAFSLQSNEYFGY